MFAGTELLRVLYLQHLLSVQTKFPIPLLDQLEGSNKSPEQLQKGLSEDAGCSPVLILNKGESSGTGKGNGGLKGGTACKAREKVWGCEGVICVRCTCVVVQMWAHGRDVSAPLGSPDVHGKTGHM